MEDRFVLKCVPNNSPFVNYKPIKWYGPPTKKEVFGLRIVQKMSLDTNR